MTQVSQPTVASRHGGYSPATGRCEMVHVYCWVCGGNLLVHRYRASGRHWCPPCRGAGIAKVREESKPTAQRFWEKVNKTETCWNWTASTAPGGYGELGIGSASPYFQYANKSMKIRAPRLSWIMHSGAAIPAGMDVCHTCDNPRCVRPDHLFLGTPAENMADAAAKRRFPHGEENHTTRLTLAQVREMKQEYSRGVTQRDIARKYGISGSSTSRIISGIDWKYA